MSRGNDTTVTGSFTTPVVAESELPGLLGFKTMRNNRAVLDMVNLQLHFCGPADINLTLPPGTEEISPSGHLVLPCTNFENIQRNPPNPLRDTAVVLPVMESGINHDSHMMSKTSTHQSTDLDLRQTLEPPPGLYQHILFSRYRPTKPCTEGYSCMSTQT